MVVHIMGHQPQPPAAAAHHGGAVVGGPGGASLACGEDKSECGLAAALSRGGSAPHCLPYLEVCGHRRQCLGNLCEVFRNHSRRFIKHGQVSRVLVVIGLPQLAVSRSLVGRDVLSRTQPAGGQVCVSVWLKIAQVLQSNWLVGWSCVSSSVCVFAAACASGAPRSPGRPPPPCTSHHYLLGPVDGHVVQAHA